MKKSVSIFSFVLLIGFSQQSLPSKVFNYQDITTACLEAVDDWRVRRSWEDKIKGMNVKLSLIAKEYSKLNNTLTGEVTYHIGASEIPIISVIETGNIDIPPGLKKDDRFVVSGSIIDGVLWGNVIDGCFFRIKGNTIEVDGF